MSELVVLVDESDEPIGEMEKMAAHTGDGHLHRAISVLVFGTDGRLLLQRRARSKHHFRGLWANTACSHPRLGEAVVEAGERRLREEMGLSAPLGSHGTFIYRAVDPRTGLVEHELDHVLVGVTDAEPVLDVSEADAWDRVDPVALLTRLRRSEAGYAPWLRPALEVVPALST